MLTTLSCALIAQHRLIQPLVHFPASKLMGRTALSCGRARLHLQNATALAQSSKPLVFRAPRNNSAQGGYAHVMLREQGFSKHTWLSKKLGSPVSALASFSMLGVCSVPASSQSPGPAAPQAVLTQQTETVDSDGRKTDREKFYSAPNSDDLGQRQFRTQWTHPAGTGPLTEHSERVSPQQGTACCQRPGRSAP